MTISMMVCKGCGQPIYGGYTQALGANWHPEHFTCTACGRPIGSKQFTLHEHRPYHLACYENTVAPRCAYCNKPLIEQYMMDQWGTMYCSVHQTQYPRCAFCSRLVPPRAQEARAETIRCTTCRSTAIESTEKAAPLFRKLIQWAGGQGLHYHNLSLTPELCRREKLAHYLQERTSVHSYGVTMSVTHTVNGQITRSEVKGVAILWGLPSLLFQGVAIHELGHVWLVMQEIRNLPSWAVEGFCELLSYRYYSEVKTVESLAHAKNIEQSNDPTYGEGFRRIRTIAELAGGWSRLIETLQTSKRLPH